MKKLLLIATILSASVSLLASECNQGGEGATACTDNETWLGYLTVTKSTSCKEGYYACCNPGSAVCKKNKTEATIEDDC